MNALVQPILKPDSDLMLAHVEHLFGGFLDGYQDGLIELAWTDTKPNPKTGKYDLANARLFGTDALDDLVTEAIRLNTQPMCNVYIGAWLRKPNTAPFGRTSDSDAWAMTAAYTDLDDPGTTAKAKDIYADSKPTWITMTGAHPHNRAQMWWRLAEPITDHDRGENLIRGMSVAFGGDDSICNPGRVMRLAGSLAWATKPGRQLELTSRAMLKKPGLALYMVEHIERVFPPKADPKKQGVDTGEAHSLTSGKILAKINDGREKYMRDTACAMLLEYIGENGAAPSAQELFDLTWPQYADKVDFGRPGRGKEEVADKCSHAIRRFEAGKIRGMETLDKAIERYRLKSESRAAFQPVSRPAPSVHVTNKSGPRFPFETIAELRSLPPQTWLAKNWVPEGATGIFYGKWAAGKSFIGFDFLLHLAYGFKEWHGVELPGEPCDVLVIAREGHHGFINRIDAFKKHHKITDDTDRVKFMRAAVSFMREDEFDGLVKAVEDLKINFRCILVDTVARVLPGVDMNEQQTVTLFMERIGLLAAVTSAAAIGVHHQNKSGGMMGSTFFEANADFVFEVSRIGDEDSPLQSGEITCTKMKDGEDRWKRSIAYKKIPLSIIPDGPSSLVIERIGNEASPSGPAWPERDVCQRILAFIHEEWCTGTPLAISKNVAEGRRAIQVIGKKFELKANVVEMVLRQWLNVRPAILSVEMADKKSKQTGLKKVGSID